LIGYYIMTNYELKASQLRIMVYYFGLGSICCTYSSPPGSANQNTTDFCE
jgi:hypothetical protein